ncbi:hypothetical protein ACD578_05240 [Microvirga sp. RSM25]|uniref:hypothetical protein n=1 Tax=Microvirga sp. RSM25 TaxID=3273802 RepID=UPI00384C98B2
MTDYLTVVTLPPPHAFPIGALVRAGEYSGEVVKLCGPYSVTIREPSGRLLTTTISDMVPDDSAVKAQPAKPAAPVDLFSYLER